MKKIIIVISSSILGGAQTYIVNLANALKAEYDVVVVCPEGNLLQRLSKAGIRTIIAEINFLTIRRLRDILQKECIGNEDVIVNAHLLGTAFYCYLAMKNMWYHKFLVTLHQPILYKGIRRIKRYTYPTIIKLLSERTFSYIAVSEEIKNDLLNFTDQKCVYIPNSVPGSKEKKNIRGISEKEIIKIGMIGRLSEEKNPFCFLEAAKRITNLHGKSIFYVIGDGPLRESMREKVEQMNIVKNVYFEGAVDNVNEWLLILDILVFSSDFEGIPLTMLEAMSAGLPVIATNVGGIPQVMKNRENGMLVEPNDPEQIAVAVKELIRNEKLYCKIQKNGIYKMENELSYENNIRKYKEVIEQ